MSLGSKGIEGALWSSSSCSIFLCIWSDSNDVLQLTLEPKGESMCTFGTVAVAIISILLLIGFMAIVLVGLVVFFGGFDVIGPMPPHVPEVRIGKDR